MGIRDQTGLAWIRTGFQFLKTNAPKCVTVDGPPERLNEASDIDLALESEPAGMSVYQLTSLLAERLGRRVDVVLLPECRFRDRIVREGEKWTLPG